MQRTETLKLNKTVIKISAKVKIFCCVLLWRILLDYMYVNFVFRVFEYMGYKLSPNSLIIIFSYITTSLIALLLPVQKKVSTFLLHIQIVLMLLPMLTIWAFDRNTMNYSIYIICIIICVFIQLFIFRDKKRYSNKRQLILDKKTAQILDNLLFIFCFISLCTLFSSAVIVRIPTLKSFDLINGVYEIRTSNQSVKALTYLSNWVAKIINPFIIGYCFYKKKYSLTIFGIVLQVLLYMIFAFKAYLFSILLVFGICLFISKKNFLFMIYILLLVASISSYLLYKFNNDLLMIPSMLIRRLFFVPAKLKFQYFDFFQIHDYAYFSDGKIGLLFGIEQKYYPSISIVIGEYFPKSGISANTGYWADGFANLGYFGIFVSSIIISIIIYILNCLSKYIHYSILLAMSAYSFFTFNDVAVFTNMLTGGIFIFLIIYFIIYSQRKKITKILD